MSRHDVEKKIRKYWQRLKQKRVRNNQSEKRGIKMYERTISDKSKGHLKLLHKYTRSKLSVKDQIVRFTRKSL